MTRRAAPGAWAAADTSEQLVSLCLPDGRYYRTKRAQRRVRLALCGYVRWRWPKLADPRCREAVETAERFADGSALVRELAAARKGADGAGRMYGSLPFILCERHLSGWHVRMLGFDDGSLVIVRDIFPDPAEPPVKVSKKWRTPTVLTLAQGCYDRRDFAGLPVLADALEDAGCDSRSLLAHLRGPGPHVRGCWAVDAVLGKG